jgi:hypothetical protein
MRRGERSSALPTLAEAKAHEFSAAKLDWITGADEVIIVPQGPDLETRLRTLTQLAHT